MKYNDEILNKITESYSKKIDENTNLDNIVLGYLEMMKNGSKIHIKPENRGKFSASAKRAGMGVQEYARKVVHDPHATTLQKQRAQFALNSKKFKH